MSPEPETISAETPHEPANSSAAKQTTPHATPRGPYPGDTNLNPPGIGLLALIKEDFRIHESKIGAQGFWALLIHRFGNWRMGLPKVIRPVFTLIYRFLFWWSEWMLNITLPYNCKVGRRVKLEHYQMLLVPREIGDDCIIRQHTTFGIARTADTACNPTIEANCDIGCGVVILGDVTIGKNSVIGANAVVTKSIPPNSVAVGIPAKVIKTLELKEED